MARSIPIKLDTFEWPTKAAAEVAFRKILRESGYQLYERITDPTHHQMLLEVLEVHPHRTEKIGPGVAHFFIGKTSDGRGSFLVANNAIGVWIERVDGTKIEFSYLTAIRSYTQQSDAKESLRIAVDHLRVKYRDSRCAGNQSVLSDLSGLPIPDLDQAQVIYTEPTWGQLTCAFAESEGGWDMLKVHSGNGAVQIGGRLVDPAIEARWLAFHNRYAKLGLATANEAARRPKKGNKPWVP